MKFETKKGYPFFPATSAFQKSIRRGEEDTALYFMVEFFNSGFDEYLWKRIKVIASEDIGLAALSMPAIIAGLYQNYTDLKKDNKENKPERLFLTHAVILLVRSKKSRLVDYAMVKCWREHDEKEQKIPDYAYDMHNQEGKRMGRGVDQFYAEGVHCENLSLQEREMEMKTAALKLHKQSPGKLKFETRKRGDKQPDIFDNNEEETE